MGFEPLTSGTAAWQSTAEVGGDLGGMGDRGTILLLMTYDPPNDERLQAWGIDPTLRGSTLCPGNRRKSSR